jgi:hypothetical protein
MLGLCVAAAASPSAAWRNRDDCGMQLRRICCSPPTPSVLLLSCAAEQRIPLDLGPGRFEIFVDGELVSGSPSKLALRADKAHVVFVKRAGHVPEMVVLRTESQSGKPRLSPAYIKLRLRPRQVRRATVTIEIVADGLAERLEPLHSSGARKDLGPRWPR